MTPGAFNDHVVHFLTITFRRTIVPICERMRLAHSLLEIGVVTIPYIWEKALVFQYVERTSRLLNSGVAENEMNNCFKQKLQLCAEGMWEPQM